MHPKNLKISTENWHNVVEVDLHRQCIFPVINLRFKMMKERSSHDRSQFIDDDLHYTASAVL